MPAPPPIVEFRDVDKRYGDGPLILERINFTAQPDDFIGLIGPSGCGKSTLLKLIAGLSAITAGSVAIEGAAPEKAVNNLSFIFQEPTLLPWLTTGKNIELPLRLRRASAAHRAETRRHALALVGLADRENFYPASFPADRKCASPSPVHFPLRPRSCCSMNLLAHSMK
jgi:NitT/TauT family transport system ATP-binding protein